MNITENKTYRTSYNSYLKAKEINEKILEDRYVNLATAILESACRDYVYAMKKIKKYNLIKKPTLKDKREYEIALSEKIRCEQFYHSRWFEILTLGACRQTPEEVMKEICHRYGL